MAYQVNVIAEEMSKLDATNYSAEDAIANYIIGHLRGYRQNANGKHLDHDFVKTAIQAYAKMLQDEGVKVA